ncbi:MAG: substrate-binding domain-containing protein [Planctomycetota bacterium]|jgi:LacI family transcriptional regulator|nr:substrate-binding domain-containing protein [Planctomycetota bacterium]
MRDIAEKAGVSIGTVHCALAGKLGVGENKRAEILCLAKTYGYRPNSIASSLKRRAIRLAAVFPGPNDANRYYFTHVWDGFHDYLASMRDYNIDVVESPYYNGATGQNQMLAWLLEEDHADGVLTLGYMDGECRTLLRRFKKERIPVVLVGSDVARNDRFCCVQPDYDVIGRTMGELLSWQAPQGLILVCAGNVVTPSNYEIVLGMEAFFRERGSEGRLLKIHEQGAAGEFFRRIEGELRRNRKITACCSVNAHSSVLLADALIAAGRAKTIPAIGCDVFQENIAALESGVFSNLVHKNPYSQAYVAAKCLTEYILNGTKPVSGTLLVGNEILFRSSLPLLRSGQEILHAVVG